MSGAARPLFRIQAVQARRNRMWSGAPVQAPLPLAVMTACLLGAVAAIALFLATQSYARKAATTGYLAPLHGVVQVAAPRAGLIVSVAVADGEIVRAGDTLVQIASERMAASGADVDASVRRALVEQRAMQLAQIALEQTNLQAQTQRVTDRTGRLQAETASLREQLSAQQGRLDLAAEQATLSRGLVKSGFVSGVEQRRREDARLGQAQALDSFRQQIAAKEGELVDLAAELAQLPNRTAARIAALRAAASELDSRIAETDGQRAYRVVAPITGRVSALQATSGNAADPARPLLSIVPDTENLEAILFVPERAIGFVAVGQAVRLSLDAFPFQRFGMLDGVVTEVARTLLRPEQLLAAGQPPSEPSYRVRATLAAQSITAYGKPVPLQADMQLRADIVFDRRTFVEWLLDPVLSQRGR